MPYFFEVKTLIETVNHPGVQHIAGEAGPRVTGVVGSFDDIHLPEESCDFCIEVDSLHHSDDLLRTLREIARKLKRGGHVNGCLTRSTQPNGNARAGTRLNG